MIRVRNWLFIITALLTIPSFASDSSLASLFELKSRVPGALVPFRISNKIANGKVVSVKTKVVSGSADCRSMKDPYLSNIVQVKCSDEAEVMLNVVVESEGKLYSLNHGPVVFKKLEGDLVELPGEDEPNPLIEQGLKIWSARCVACHNPPSGNVLTKGSTTSGIRAAINSIPQMNGTSGVDLRTMPTSDDVALAAYIKSL